MEYLNYYDDYYEVSITDIIDSTFNVPHAFLFYDKAIQTFDKNSLIIPGVI